MTLSCVDVAICSYAAKHCAHTDVWSDTPNAKCNPTSRGFPFGAGEQFTDGVEAVYRVFVKHGEAILKWYLPFYWG